MNDSSPEKKKSPSKEATLRYRRKKKWDIIQAIIFYCIFPYLLITFSVQQYSSIVSDGEKFWMLLGVLIFLSFYSSATEAAFGNSKVLSELKQDIKERQKELESDAKDLITDENIFSIRKIFKLLYLALKRDRLLYKNLVFSDGIETEDYIGSFAALSVFLNTGMIAFIGFTLVNSVPPDCSVQIYFSKTSIGCDKKIFLFFSASIPILLLGKILPKLTGRKKSKFFVKNLYLPNRLVKFMLGFITVGTYIFGRKYAPPVT